MPSNFQSVNPVRSSPNAARSEQSFDWLWIDAIKGVAILGIILTHIVEPLFGTPLIGFPSNDWGSLSDRIMQLQPLSLGIWSIPLNLLRYLGWMGNYGVALFIIASGFGLTVNRARQVNEQKPLDYRKFWLSRCKRIYPMWILIHAVCIVSWLATGWGLSITNWRTWVSLSGWRILPSTPHYFVAAWWFVGLILQLYLLYPLLWHGLKQWGAKRFLGCCCLLGLGVRAIGFLFIPKVVGVLSMGTVGLARLPEFALGMVFAYAIARFPLQTKQFLTQFLRKLMLTGFLLFVLGTAIGLTRSGAIFFHLLTGGSLYLLLYLAFSNATGKFGSAIVRICSWFGRHSYALFLVHAPIFARLLPLTGWQAQSGLNLVQVLGAFLLSIIAARLLEQVSDWCLKLPQKIAC